MPNVPQFVLERGNAPHPIFSADEVADWPGGLLDELLVVGVLKPWDNATTFACQACGHDHVETVQYIESPPGSGLRAYIPCPDNGRVRVPLERLRQWVVDRSKLPPAQAALPLAAGTQEDPFGSRARETHLRLAAEQLDRRAYAQLGAAVADQRSRGFAAVGFHPVCTEVIRMSGELIERALEFDEQAKEYELKRAKVQGTCSNPFSQVRADELFRFIARRIDGSPAWIRSAGGGGPLWSTLDERHVADLCRIENEDIARRINLEYGKRRAEFELDREGFACAPGDDALIADLRRLIDALEGFLESGETSEGDNPEALDCDALEDGGYVRIAVQAVQLHYPSHKLPAPEARNPWRCLLNTCRHEKDALRRQNQAHRFANELQRWAECEVERLSTPTVSPTGADNETQSEPAGSRAQRRQRQKAGPLKRSWTQGALDDAIREYRAKRASTYADLVASVQRGDRGAKKDAQRLFGRNAIARELGVKSRAMVTKSPDWQAIATELKLPRPSGRRGTTTPQRIGVEIALEEQAVAASETVVDQVVRRETIRLINTSMPAAEAEATIEKLERGEITDEQARDLVAVHADQRRDDRTRRIRHNP